MVVVGADAGEAWGAVTRVWGSKWNHRAFTALAAAGARPGELQMAVLAQGVLPAAYAWVAHTRHPVTGAPCSPPGRPAAPPPHEPPPHEPTPTLFLEKVEPKYL